MREIDKDLITKLRSALTNGVAESLAASIDVSSESSALRPIVGRSQVYDSKFKTLMNQYMKIGKTRPETIEDYTMFARWLVDVHRLTLNSSSWNLYRSTINAVLPFPEIRVIVNVRAHNKKADVPKRSSAKRLKRMPDGVYTRIVGYLQQSPSKYADVTQRLLFVVRKCGIRPAEIMHSEVISFEQLKFLKVRSLKHEGHIVSSSIVHARFQYRYIPLIHLSPDEIHYLTITLTHFSQVSTKEIFDDLYNAIRLVFQRVCKNLNLSTLDQSYGLYSARQQFSADLKATTIHPELRSMIMAHNETETIRHHYARTSDGKAMWQPDARFEKLLRDLYANQI